MSICQSINGLGKIRYSTGLSFAAIDILEMNGKHIRRLHTYVTGC